MGCGSRTAVPALRVFEVPFLSLPAARRPMYPSRRAALGVERDAVVMPSVESASGLAVGCNLMWEKFHVKRKMHTPHIFIDMPL